MPWYIPSQSVRKAQSGQRCPGCSLYMHHKDMVAWSGPTQTLYLHDQCAQILIDTEDSEEVQSEDVIREDSTSAAEH